MILDTLIVLVACVGGYFIGWLDGRDSEEKHWIQSFNNQGVVDE